MGKVRFQMFIDENKKEALERLQHDYKVSVAEIVRKAIDRLLMEYKAKEKRPLRDSTAEKLLSAAGACKGGRSIWRMSMINTCTGYRENEEDLLCLDEGTRCVGSSNSRQAFRGHWFRV